MPMRHTRLGRTGLSVSRLCLGTMTFGLQARLDDMTHEYRRGDDPR